MELGAAGCKRMSASSGLSGRQEWARALKPFPEERDICRTTAPCRFPAILGQEIIGYDI
jgi:hypothetical protein